MSWPQALTLSLSIIFFAAGVVLNALSARRDNERRTIQEAAAQMCSATSEVIAHLKALERARAPGDDRIKSHREQLERALPAVAAAHGRVRLAAGLADLGRRPPRASDWSQVLTRITLRIGDVVLADVDTGAVLEDPRNDERVRELLTKIDYPPGGDVGDVLGDLREKFIKSARDEAAGSGLSRLI